MKKPYILYDSQIFDLQIIGGISRYFCEIISRLQQPFDISIRYSENYYLKNSTIARHRRTNYFTKISSTQRINLKHHLLIFYMLLIMNLIS